MNYYLLLLLVLVFPVKGQQLIGIVKDSEQRPIPYANVFLNNHYGIQTDSLGRFRINDYPKPEKIEVQKTGYEPVLIYHTTLQSQPDIILKKLPFTPVKQANVSESLTIGFQGKEKALEDMQFPLLLNYEAGVVFKYQSDFNNKIISKVRLHTFSLGEADFNLRLNVYSLNLNGEPDENLIKKEVYFTSTSKRQWVDLDLEEQNIRFPESGVAITAELLNAQMKRTKINLSSRPIISGYKNKKYQWLYRGNNWPMWKIGDGMSYAMQLVVK